MTSLKTPCTPISYEKGPQNSSLARSELHPKKAPDGNMSSRHPLIPLIGMNIINQNRGTLPKNGMQHTYAFHRPKMAKMPLHPRMVARDRRQVEAHLIMQSGRHLRIPFNQVWNEKESGIFASSDLARRIRNHLKQALKIKFRG